MKYPKMLIMAVAAVLAAASPVIPAAEATRGKVSLKIIKAVYGGAKGEKDVTSLIASKVTESGLSIPIDNQTLQGDPSPQAPKKLTLDYELDGKRFTKDFAENTNLSIPEGRLEDFTAKYKVAKGFKLERVYQVPPSQGSWVSMTVRDDGILYCADQYGAIYQVRPPGGPESGLAVAPVKFQLRGAHGLLWHKGVLWVTANEGPEQSGLWKVTDTDKDGHPDKPELIKGLRGGGEHGPHALVASPDGAWIYLAAGNHTDIPEFQSSLMPKHWGEDQLLPRRPDANGHATNRMAPGGWIARFKPEDAAKWQLFSGGYRNQYDIAFNEHGDLFTFDADMEWDFGMPWYRPTRICHVTPGSEFGWRFGTGKWPEYYEDSMPPLLNIGPGSPTGMLSGKGARFPEKYQKAVYALDWTFATIYALHLTPSGGSYTAEREEFLAGNGLALTDAVIGTDGAMYFLTGGRRSNSALWRVSYTGTPPAKAVVYKNKNQSLPETSAAIKGVGSADRVTRHQSRIALELAGIDTIAPLLPKARTPWQVITLSIAAARAGKPEHVPAILKALDSLDWKKLDTAQQINWLRAASLAFARHGYPDEDSRKQVLAKIDAAFPADDDMLNRELCRMLCYLQAPGIVARTLALMDSTGPGAPPDWLELASRNPHYGNAVSAMIHNLPPTQVIHYIYCLRAVKGPWQADERKRFFAWFPKISGRSGGNSYAGFLRDLSAQAVANASPEEKESVTKLAQTPPANPFANLPKPKGPGKAWTVADVEKVASSGLDKADRENGRLMFQASLCSACHRFGGEGGSVGPDLTTVAGRFTARDFAEAILEPSKAISDQYEFTQLNLKDNQTLVGRILREEAGQTVVASNPFDFSQTTSVPTDSIVSKKPSAVSPMPAGLIHSLNEKELKDLLAYLLNSK